MENKKKEGGLGIEENGSREKMRNWMEDGGAVGSEKGLEHGP